MLAWQQRRRKQNCPYAPLDIEVTKNWEQIIAEVWAAVSHGRVPSLPVPVILGDNDDVDADALEAEAA